MDPATAFMAKAVIDTIGGIIGGKSKKDAAKEKYRITVKGIRSEFRQRMEDLVSGTRDLWSQIQNVTAGSGVKGGAYEIEKAEADKFTLRTFRLKEQEDQAIAEAKFDRKQGIKAGDFQMASSIVSAPFDYEIGQAKADTYYG